jgi:serine protease AprX
VQLKQRAAKEEKKKVENLCKQGCQGELSLLDAFYGELNPNTIQVLVNHDHVFRIYYDREVRAYLDIATKTTGARAVQIEEGLTGKGITIAILDTGVYPHKDLMEPKQRIIAFVDFVNNRTDPYDDHGHGTHCAGDAAGNGFLSQGLYAGPAPEANIVGVKVLDGQGGGKLSTVIKGIEWCVEKREELGIRILSLSLGTPALESYRYDPLAQAAERAWHLGLVVCAAAGNEGPHAGTISSPGHDPVILTVGAADDKNTESLDDDEIAQFSSRGPTNEGLVKPDLYAPGADIVSLNSPGSQIEMQLPENKVNDDYIRLSGTSMATPICAGIVALLLEANPYLSPNDVKSILMSTSREIPNEQAGYVDVKRAIQLAKKYFEFQKRSVVKT